MTSTPSASRVLVPTGALGIGAREDELEVGLSLSPHAIAVDAGSTDSGPAALATGRSKYSRQAVKRDLSLLMRAQARARIPLLVGSCGTSGCDGAVDWTLDIAQEIARENGLSPRIAVLYSEQEKTLLKAKAALGLVHPLPPARPVDDATLNSCEHIVALLGPEPYIAAVQAGADIVLGGRTSDPAVLAAVPLMRGELPGAAWHAGKIAECGGLCSTSPLSPGVMITVDRLGFSVAPLSPVNRCTPETVSAHMLYENSNPFRLTEPGGVLDVTDARYEALDSRTVRVTGSRFEPAPYTHKLEGASRGPFQTLLLIGIQDPEVLGDVDGFLARMSSALRERLERNMGPLAADVHISLRPYGWNAVSGRALPKGTAPPHEVGLLLVSTASTQELATEAARTCNPTFFHLPARDGLPKPSYAFPFSPAEVERGQVFEFRLNHVVEVPSPLELVRMAWPTAGSAAQRGRV